MFGYKPVRAVLFRYIFALMVFAIALLLSASIENITEDSPFIFYYGAVILSAWLGGFGPGLLVALLAIVSTGLPNVDTPLLLRLNYGDLVQLIVFGLIAVLVSWLEQTRLATEQILREDSESFQIILNNVADAITAINTEERFIYANAAAAQISGIESPQAMQEMTRSFMEEKFNLYGENGDTMPFEDLPSRRAMREGVNHQLVYMLEDKGSGQRRWLSLKSTPVFDKQGQVRMVINIFRDISDRKQIETLREQNERRLRDVLDNLPIAVGVLSTEGCIIGANQSMCSSMGADLDALRDRPLEDTVWWSGSEDRRATFREAVKRAASGEVVRHDTSLTQHDGQTAIVEFTLSPLRDPNGQIYALLPCVVDITERQRAIDERTRLAILLETQRRRLQNLIANVPGILWEGQGAPGDGQKVEFVSEYAEHMLGYPVEEWTAEPGFWSKIAHPDDLAKASKEAEKVFSESKQGNIQFRVIARDGRVIPVEARTLIVSDETSTSPIVTGLVMDITERVEAEQALARYAADLKRSNDELQQFAYVASHDLQEPLRMVASYLQLLQRRYQDKLDEDANEFIGYAVDGATRMKALITDLLTYSRVQTKQQPFTHVDLSEVVRIALENLQLSIEDNDAEIICDEMPVVHGDSRQLLQVFQNLIGNAIKFRAEAVPRVHITARRKGREWLIAVSDNGIGIEEDYRERIFVIFQRLHAKGKYPGTGIGLAICKKVIEQHGGRIWVDSQPGAGTTFSFTLPAGKQR